MTEYNTGEKEPLKHGVKIRAKLKRGTGTRDQDEILIEGRGEDTEEAASEFNEALEWAEEEDWNQRLRDVQPEDPEGEGDDD